eukprot:c7830_g1_i1.p1 GENE.c7830_g1_i1~~c7830_g1_i1.p1  ORF type:complete len:722 (+),score=186.48 c7830_g1_i1:807-2972(+)
MASLPWKDKYMLPVNEEGKAGKRVRFQPNIDQIPRPQYNDDNTDVKYVGPPLTKSISSLKKRKFVCRNPKGLEGQLSITNGEVTFACPERTKHNWSCPLSDVIHLESLADTDDPLYCKLCFTLKDKSKVVFSKILVSHNAYEALINDAETLGFVLVLDQLLTADRDSKVISAMHLVDLFDGDSLRKKRSPLLAPLTSKGVRRFVNNKFNLDLSYISKRVVVMAYPGQGVKAIAFNPLATVRNFFESRHPHAYMIYNLNLDPRYQYDPSLFEGRVRSFGFEEHSPPRLGVLMQLLHDMGSYLRQSPTNVVAVHCKAGKGRSGCVGAAWLIHCGLFDDHVDAVNHVNRLRMINGPAIQLPSQIRYVGYVEQIEKHGYPDERVLTLTKVTCEKFQPKKGAGVLLLRFFGNQPLGTLQIVSGNASVTETIVLDEDIRVDGLLDGSHCFTTHFNTRMISNNSVTFSVPQLDGFREFKSFHLLQQEFEIAFHFAAPNNRESTATEAASSSSLQNVPITDVATSADQDLEAPAGFPASEPDTHSGEHRRSIRDLDPSRKSPQKIMRKPTGYIKRIPAAEREAEASSSNEEKAGDRASGTFLGRLKGNTDLRHRNSTGSIKSTSSKDGIRDRAKSTTTLRDDTQHQHQHSHDQNMFHTTTNLEPTNHHTQGDPAKHSGPKTATKADSNQMTEPPATTDSVENTGNGIELNSAVANGASGSIQDLSNGSE